MAAVEPFEVSTKTDENGRFGFAPVGSTLEHPYDPLRLSADAGALCGETTVYSMPTLGREFIELVVGPCQGLGGIVTDAAGAPIENAEILLKEWRETDAEFSPIGFGPFSTGQDGKFAIKNVTGGRFQFMVVAGTFVSPEGVAQFYGLTPGSYIAVVVALPNGSEITDATLLQSALAGRYAAAQVDAPAGEVAQIQLPLP